jgi:hypothetical protein
LSQVFVFKPQASVIESPQSIRTHELGQGEQTDEPESVTSEASIMHDVIFIGIGVIFFVIGGVYAAFCNRA